MIGCLVSAAILATSAPQIVHLNISSEGKPIGTEDFEFKKLPNDECQIKITLHITSNQIVMVAKSQYDSKGKWISKSLDVSLGQQSAHATASLEEAGANVDAPGPNGRFKHILQPPTDESLLDPTVWWWRTVKPKVGTEVNFAYFNLEKVQWEKTVFTYVGDKTMVVNGKSTETHEVEQGNGTDKTDYYYDDSGDPVLIVGKTKTEMTSKTTDNQSNG